MGSTFFADQGLHWQGCPTYERFGALDQVRHHLRGGVTY